jgi:hypothetical protein
MVNEVLNHNHIMLDLVLTNSLGSSVLRSIDPIFPLDPHHPPLDIRLLRDLVSSNSESAPTTFRNFKRADYGTIVEQMGFIDWIEVFRDGSLNTSIDEFYRVVNGVIESYIPEQTFLLHHFLNGLVPTSRSLSLIKNWRTLNIKQHLTQLTTIDFPIYGRPAKNFPLNYTSGTLLKLRMI